MGKTDPEKHSRSQKQISSKDKIPQKSLLGSHRKAITAGAAIILVIIIIGVIAMVVPGIMHTGADNSTTTGFAVITNPKAVGMEAKNSPGDMTIPQNTAATTRESDGATITPMPDITKTQVNGQSGVKPGMEQSPEVSETPAIVQPPGVSETPAIGQPPGVVATPAIIQPTGVVATPAIVQPTGVVETPATPAP
jgi:hypothetical protein